MLSWLCLLGLVGCQVLLGDYEIDDSGIEVEPPLEICEVMDEFRCDGPQLYLCPEAGSQWVKLPPCTPAQECSVSERKCVSASASGNAGGPPMTQSGADGGAGGTNAGAAASAGSGAMAATTGGTGNGDGGSGDEPCDALSGEDCCPDDPLKSEAGACGCGIADTDTDEDGTPDCLDECPEDPLRVRAGACGCGTENTLACAVLRASLAHRYSFDGQGTQIEDSSGLAHGTLINAQLSESGTLELAGGTTDQYVALPSPMLAGFTNVTFEVWLTWRGGDAWQRIFDFGSNNMGQGNQGIGASYVFLTPQAANASGFARVAFTTAGNSAETILNATRALAVDTPSHVALAIDADRDTMTLFLDGALESSVAFAGQLAAISDLNNWLGRSQFSADPELNAILDEFRIYQTALGENEIRVSFAVGPNAAF